MHSYMYCEMYSEAPLISTDMNTDFMFIQHVQGALLTHGVMLVTTFNLSKDVVIEYM